ncbi:hypothetical protein PR202_ga18858 [Eleusine coracana subsp. coracana]|uniref:Shikimate kinase n=1 Tax=Eleusine coracana subsp. coracana TaxID=191504 RepID=A0AAV5CU31_ELECO|nr:hypothetical protein PR202_ga18858 [Eleusine coracana subsp. coracana]
MEASVGLRAQPRAWAGIEKPRGTSSARVPAVRFAPEQQPHRLVLGTDPRRSTGPVPVAKLKASCYKASSGTERVHYSADEALILKEKAADVLPYLDGRCVYLVGMMGSGKTTVGKILAEVLGYSFFDSDKLVEKAVGMSSVAEIFQLRNEAFFRDNEELHEERTDGVVRCSTGCACKKDCCRGNCVTAPLASGIWHMRKLTALFEQRMDSYANAHARVSLEHIAIKQGHNDVTILTPSAIAIEALLKMKSFLTEKAMVRN